MILPSLPTIKTQTMKKTRLIKRAQILKPQKTRLAIPAVNCLSADVM
jgi:hypothetical protein